VGYSRFLLRPGGTIGSRPLMAKLADARRYHCDGRMGIQFMRPWRSLILNLEKERTARNASSHHMRKAFLADTMCLGSSRDK
jgi:hypothetical protein